MANKNFTIVLVEPQIPPNTGSVARMCAGTGARLFLVGQLGFSTSDKQLKRAGLDYWPYVDISYWPDLKAVEEADPKANFYYLTTHSKRTYTSVAYKPGDYLVFGKESSGLGTEILGTRPPAAQITIPMPAGHTRSLNLATCTGIVLYEALRQTEGW